MMYDFKLDIVFKSFFSNENDTDSRALLSCLVDGTLGRNVAIERILNPNYLQDDPKDKGVRYDIKIEDALGNHIDIEMQNSSLSNTLVRRFVFYGSKLIGEDVHVGDKYDDMKSYIQIILIDDMKEDEPILIGKYDPRTPQGNREGKDMEDEDILLMRYYIYLPYINVIASEKGLMNMSDYELLLYMIENGMEEVRSMKDREIVKIMERKEKEMEMNEHMKELAFNRMVYQMCEKAEKQEFMAMGEKRGIAIGETIGERKMLVKMLKRKYPQEDFGWMKECDDNIIKEIEELIYQPISYEEFYQSIHKKMN